MIAFDNETTGLKRPDACDLKIQPYITEIYLCKFDFDGNIHAEFNKLVKPPVPIPEIITKITGIDDNMVKNAPTFIEIYDELVDFVLGEKTIFAHNCSFDIDVLKGELKRFDMDYNFPWPPYQCCTVEASMAIQNKRLTLDKLFEVATGKPRTEGSHRARKDVLDMVKCIKWLKKEGFIHDIFC